MTTERVTFYIEKELRHALRLKAAETGETLSTLLNEALKAALSEDLEDLTDAIRRKKEPRSQFESVVQNLKKRGLL
jgi:predicted DNA-binding protein